MIFPECSEEIETLAFDDKLMSTIQVGIKETINTSQPRESLKESLTGISTDMIVTW